MVATGEGTVLGQPLLTLTCTGPARSEDAQVPGRIWVAVVLARYYEYSVLFGLGGMKVRQHRVGRLHIRLWTRRELDGARHADVSRYFMQLL